MQNPYNPYAASATPYNPYQSYSTPQGLDWVQGEAVAKAWQVAPGNTVALFDSEEPVIYIKTADQTGLPTMKVLDYTIREPVETNGFVTKTDLDKFKEEILAAIKSKEVPDAEPAV